jgi:hypothetical protein
MASTAGVAPSVADDADLDRIFSAFASGISRGRSPVSANRAFASAALMKTGLTMRLAASGAAAVENVPLDRGGGGRPAAGRDVRCLCHAC